MTENELVKRAKQRIGEALQAIDEERRKLKRALEHLDGDRAQKRSTPKRRPSRRTLTSRADRGEPGKRFLDALKRGPGTVGELAKRVGMPGSTAMYADARKLLAEGRVEKRGAVYALPGSEADAETGQKADAKQERARTPGRRASKSGGASIRGTTIA